MNNLNEIKKTLREIDKTKYPELKNYKKEDIWRDIGPGGLYLVSLLGKELQLKNNSLVLDLGCGMAESSIYLAENYNVYIIAVDLWNNPTKIAEKIEKRNCKNKIIPLKLDASKNLPFAENYFDAIICINNLNFYATDLTVIKQIIKHLKNGGIFCSGGECLNEEFTPEQIKNPPDVYNFAKDVWENDFLTSHSPLWWGKHIAKVDNLELIKSEEIVDGPRFYEEQALLAKLTNYSIWGLTPEQGRELEIKQIFFGRKNRQYMTNYKLVTRKK